MSRVGVNTPCRAAAAVVFLMAALALAGALGGCSRRAEERPQSAAPPDTLADGLPRALEPQLAAWVQIWRHALPGFTADSLARAETVPFRFGYAWVGAAGARDDVRIRAGIQALSPDSTRLIDVDGYLEFERDAAGAVQLMREPDSQPLLADFPSDTLWSVAFCGTVCAFDGAYWIDAERFALTGNTQSGPGADGPRQGFLDIYDLRTRSRSRWVTRLLDDPEWYRYADACDSALAARIAAAAPTGPTANRL